MRRLKAIEMLPTMITLGNLFSGFLAMAYLTDAHGLDDAARLVLCDKAIFCIFLAMVFDALDGKIARMTGAASPFGAQIDSLSDVVSFGCAPALMFKVMVEAGGVIQPKLALVLAVLYVACAALRLARFNVETDVAEDAHLMFKGLPSPAAAAFVAALTFLNIYLDPAHGKSWVLWAMPWLVAGVAFLMVSRFPYVHLSNWLFKDRKPFKFLVALLFLGAVTVWSAELVLPLGIAAFVLTGPIVWARRRMLRKPGDVVSQAAGSGGAEDADEEELI